MKKLICVILIVAILVTWGIYSLKIFSPPIPIEVAIGITLCLVILLLLFLNESGNGSGDPNGYSGW